MIKQVGIKHYLTLLFLPIICIALTFGYAIKYINDEIVFIKNEIIGLKKTKNIHEIVINLQRLRGISSMPLISKKYSLEKKQYIYETKIKIEKTRQNIKPNLDVFFEDKSIHNFLLHILQLFKEQHNYSQKEIFKNYTNINEKSFNIQKDIALYSNLKFDSYRSSHILMETIIVQLPKLIEYNGQLRALLTGLGNKQISKIEYLDLNNRIAKIDNLADSLQYNMKKILKNNNYRNLDTYYENMVNSKNKLLEYIYLNYKQHTKINNPEVVYEFFTKHINLIIDLYNINTKTLDTILKQRIQDKTTISNYIVNIGVVCLLFIIFNFFNYYRKNNDLIIAINNSNKKLKEQSISDALTRLYNRRYFDIIFEQKLKQCKRDKTSFIFIMCDIDYFKKYNDTYGHALGDKTLIKVSQAIKNTLKRPNDFAFRIGGEEFGILLSDMSFNKAKAFAKTIKFNIEKLHIEHKINDNNNYLTISMGIAYVSKSINHFDKRQLYNCADKALYKSKEKGRNRISTCELDTTE